MQGMRIDTVLHRAAWVGIILAIATGSESVKAIDLTFLGWADQHVNTDGTADHCAEIIAALNSMAGRPLPESIGGTVDTPAFIISAGDMTEWPTWAAKETYNDIITHQLIYPTYDVMGNHDFGGTVPNDTVKNWFLGRYGSYGATADELSYSFNRGGVHFSMLDSYYDPYLGSPAQPISQQAIDWLKADLANVDDLTPVVVVTHLCYDAITNKEEFVTAFEGKNVVLVLGGHYEKPTLHDFQGYSFVQLPSPRGEIKAVDVFRITDDRLIAAVWNVDTQSWMTQYTLDKAIVPEPTSLAAMSVAAIALGAGRGRRRRRDDATP